LVEAFAVCQALRKIGIHVAAGFLDLGDGTLHGRLVGETEFLDAAQERDDTPQKG